ncbi:MAG: 23S rRNA (pseudouridine(1915)-N(3))-methyltransferase RlmH [Bacillota bacterium]|nr:23S rRNA (pseudouridine(1915)-N(3))-methyltransferase RlmH [Bacillota bacterium]
MPLTLTIVTPGKSKETWLQAAIDDYVRRLRRYCAVRFVIVRDVPDDRPVHQVIDDEGKNILTRLRPQDYVIALDLGGEQPDSPQLAVNLIRWLEAGGSEIIFVIGGANGLDEAVLQRAQHRLCLSRLTWTHQMTRLLLLEQCYRAFRILNNEPYHK